MKRLGIRATALALAVLVGLSPTALASEALGDELHSGSVGLAPGVDYTRQAFWSNSRSDLRTERYFTYTPGSGVYPTAVYGEYVLSRATLTNMAKGLEEQGHRVIGGVNGDFYMVTTGAPLGILVSDGILRSTSGGYYAVGFREDGTAFIGSPAVGVTATFSGYTLAVRDVNKIRTGTAGDPDTGGYYLFTNDFGKTTQNTTPGVDVILTPITEGLGSTVEVDVDVDQPLDQVQAQSAEPTPSADDPDPDEISDSQSIPPGNAPEGKEGELPEEVKGTLTRTDQLTIGGRVSCVVEQVLQSTGSIEIPQGKMVLSISNNSHEWLVSMASQLQAGDRVELDVTSADERWNDAVTALGGFYKIVTGGQVGPHTDNAANPRTAIGIKADGTVVFYTIDGRQPGYSIGATLTQVAQRLIELGCVEAVGLDGGGSTTMVGTMPWNSSTEVLNIPSDGASRAVTNALFLVSDLAPTGVPDHFIVTPYDNFVLAGAQVEFRAVPVDSSYYSTTYDNGLTWSVYDGDGMVDANGVFTAGGEDGTTFVAATSPDGQLTGSAPVSVVRSPDSITISRQQGGEVVTSLTLDPGQSVDLTATALRRKLTLVSQDSCYTWTADPAVGTVDENGLFAAADKSGTGTLTVSAGDTVVRIPVTVAGHVQALNTFETDAELAALTGTDTVTVAPETVADQVRYGVRSARLAYNAAGGSANLAVDLPLPAGERYLSLWVYGDGSGNAFTATLADSAGQTQQVLLSALDFTGWKRVSAPLPQDAAALRALSVIYGGGEKSAGTLWIDQLTTANEDFADDLPPTVTVTVSGTQVSAQVTDHVDRRFSTGAISASYDGEPLSFQWDETAGKLTATIPADDGKLHRVTVTAVDQSGNIGRGSANVLPLASTDPDHATVPADPGPFLDMTTHWAGLYSTYLYNMGVVKGVETDGGYEFQPEKNITRGEFFLMMARWMGLDLDAYAGVELPFADTGSIPAWAQNGIKAMYARGILKGSLDNGLLLCRANDTISRAEAMTVLGRIQPKGYAQQPLTFADSDSVAAWALPYVQSLTGQGIISGYDNLLRPNDPMKRGEVTKVLFFLL